MPCSEGEYEWTATVYNINDGHNKELMNKCKILQEYATMVAKIREFQQKGLDLDLSIEEAIEYCLTHDVLKDFLLEEVVDLLRMYFTYVTDNPSPQLMVFGLVFSIYFPMRATNSLMAAVRTAYHLGPPKGFITQWIKVLLYTVTLIVTIALTLSLMTFGERALWYTVEHFHLPEFLAKLWVTLRFPVAGAVSFLALFLLYALAQDTIQPLKNICPGVLFSLAAWMAFSWLYSYYANHFSHYSVLYGSIGAVIVVLIWLNLSAFTLILGAEMNGVLISMRKDRLEQDTNVPKA